jgi:hypothetical protein
MVERERELVSLFYVSDCELCAVALFGLLQSQVSIWGFSLSPLSKLFPLCKVYFSPYKCTNTTL